MALRENAAGNPPNVLNLPDIQFVNWCYRHFGLNRGVYNTIDEWLYGYGLRSIVARRNAIVAFLEYAQQSSRSGAGEQGGILRFGKGALIATLREFAAKYEL